MKTGKSKFPGQKLHLLGYQIKKFHSGGFYKLTKQNFVKRKNVSSL